MTQKIKWPPKDFEMVIALLTIFVKEKDKASMSLFKERLGMSKSTVNRYLRIMREVFGMKIYFLRQGRTGKYIVEDFGCFDQKWFKQRPRVQAVQEPKKARKVTSDSPTDQTVQDEQEK